MTDLNAPQRDAELGYDFTLDLCEAIAAATTAAHTQDPGAFRFKNIDLIYAVERELYITLVNNPSVRAVYRSSRDGLALPAVSLRLPFEAEVIRRLVPHKAIEFVPAPAASRLRRVAREARATSRHWRQRRIVPTQLPQQPIVALIHHPKFLRFLRPVIERLDRSEIVVASSTYDLTQELNALGVAGVGLFSGTDARQNGGLLNGTDSPAAAAALLSLVQDHRPRSLIVLEGNHPWDEAASRVASALDTPCYCLQHGWSPFVHTGFRNMTYTSMLVWGQGFTELLAPYNPQETFAAVGNPALGDTGEQRHPAAPEERRVVFFLQATSQLISEEMRQGMQTLIRAFSDRFPNATAVVREHPGHPISESERASLRTLPNVELVPPSEFALTDVLRGARASVSIYSTTILESIATLVPPVIYNPTSMSRYSPDIDALGAGIEVKETRAVLDAIARLLTDDGYHASFVPGMQQVRERFFGDELVGAADRIAAAITGR